MRRWQNGYQKLWRFGFESYDEQASEFLKLIQPEDLNIALRKSEEFVIISDKI